MMTIESILFCMISKNLDPENDLDNSGGLAALQAMM